MRSTPSALKAADGDVTAQNSGAGSSAQDGCVSSSQRRFANLLRELIDVLRAGTDDPVLPANQMAVILYVAAAVEPPSVVEICKAIGFSDAAGSRSVQVLGRGIRGQSGAGLLYTKEDPLNYSRKQVHLTPKGLELVSKLENTLLAGLKRGL